ncbi:AraC family transcriptional regulator [Pedobacter foliorum]|uniref:helix-turn-helix domain-containing protein n=1 Tax=Pedobacter foliorum TaxID=2739058 RepID=UPI001567B7F2|nr:AraC family transcriptional regulator [Pedobacter foliorum]NRF37590.1 helix-turn-helix transcriptional regulator [Pedobacter foliorum]
MKYTINYDSNVSVVDMKTSSLTMEYPEILHLQNVPGELQVLIDLIGLIEKHFRKERSPGYYAISLSIKTFTLNSLSKKILRKTIYELIQDKIHHEAIKLLTTTNWSVKRIAYEIGGNDPCYFNRCFKKKTGLSPKRFRSSGFKLGNLNDPGNY